MSYLVIVRHGHTQWSGRFTGWTDIDLTPEGIKLTKKYAQRLKEKNFVFDIGFTSYLKRGIKTLYTVLEVLDLMWIPVVKDWRLNERHYGALQEENKAAMVEKFGEKQLKLWRRSFHHSPPKVGKEDRRHPTNHPRYQHIHPEKLPAGESLRDTYRRSIPYFKKFIEPQIKKGKRIILSGHHNFLRSIIKYLDNISDEEVVNLNVPYCIPLVYEFDLQAKPIKRYYLASEKEIKEIVDSIKNQIKKLP